MGHRHFGPRFCLQDNPDGRSVKLGGRYINVSLLANVMDANHGYLCRILAGKRDPTISFLEKMGEALGMGIEELRTAIKARAEELRSH